MDKTSQRMPFVLLCALADAVIFLGLWIWLGEASSAFTVWLLVSFAAGLLGMVVATIRRTGRFQR
jgi:hypothetical protein